MSPLPPRHIEPASDDPIDLGRLLHAILRYKWGILGLAFAITMLTGLLVFSMEPIYRASSSIVLESEQVNLVGVEDIYGLSRFSYDYALTEFEILRSRSIAERVVRKLQLDKTMASQPAAARPWYKPDLKALLPAGNKEPPVQLSAAELEAQTLRRATSAVMGGLSFTPSQESLMVYVSFESTDPALAAQVANTTAEEFINANLENRLSGTLQATQWLSERMEALKENLRVSELALQAFREREGLVSVEGVTGLGGNELKILSQRMENARRTRIEAQNIKEDVQGLNNATTEELMTVPAVLQHQLIRDLTRDQSITERRVAELGKRYGVKHPKMIAARSDLSTANEELGSEVRKVVSGINREYEIALRNEQQLEATWEASKTEVQDFNRKEFQLQELQREVETNRQLYDVFFNRIKSVSETGGFEKPHARIVDRAQVPGSPFKPNKQLSLLLAFLGSLLLGCAIALVLEILDNTVKSPDDVQSKLGVALLGTLPAIKTDKSGSFEQFWQQPGSGYAESIRTIRTGVVLSSLDDPARVIVVTSTVPGEGKSTIALNLGAALAQMENTLVIGADLRRPSLARQCGLAPNHSGLTHFISGTAGLDDCIEHLPDLNLHVMPAGIIPPNPLEMIGSRKFVEGLNELRQRFDRIVIDSAPVHAVSDALILASYADSVIYVVQADSTSATQASKGIDSILASNEPLTGVVLNHFDARKTGGRYGDKYYQYGGYSQSDELAGA